MTELSQIVLPEPLPTTGLGSMPGTHPVESARTVAGEFSVPHLVELPARGPGADMIGRTLSLVRTATGEFAGQTTPSGWRLVATRAGGDPGRQMRRAAAWLGEDSDALEQALAGFTGQVKVQLAGPWTVAAAVESTTGRKLLADPGACADLAAALAQATREHVAAMRRRIPAATFVVQVDEPTLPTVARGQVRSASGLERLRTPEEPELVAGLASLVSAVGGTGATSLVHCCASRVPYGLLARAGFSGVSIDLSKHASSADADVGSWWDSGGFVALGVVPALDATTEVARVAAGVTRLWERIGFDFDAVGRRTLLTPSCGLAGASPGWPIKAARILRGAAAQVGEGRR